MELKKQGIDVSFAEGLDTKTDPKRVKIGKFLSLQNSVFQKGGLLQKRNGYGLLPALPDTTYSYLTTFNGNLTAVGTNIAALNDGGSSWVQKGSIQPLDLSTLPLIRNNLNQTACDAAVAPNGLVCTVYLESNGSTTTNKYAIADAVTGQNIVAPVAIPVASGTPTGGMRVFVLGTHFIIVFTNVITATSHLQYVAVSYNNPTLVGSNTDIAASYISATTLSWDAYVVGTNLYVAYNTTSGGQAIKVTRLSASLSLAAAVTFAASIATAVSVTADVSTPSNPVIWVSFYDSVSRNAFALAVDSGLNTLRAPGTIVAGVTALNITSAAQSGTLTVFLEIQNAYSTWVSGNVYTNYIGHCTYALTGSSSSFDVVVRSVGLGSKAFIVGTTIYVLGAFSSAYQPTYFLVNATASVQAAPVLAAKLAYQNGGGYLTKGLPSVTVTGTTAQLAYLFKDLIQAVNKNTAVPTGTQVAGIFSQTGINLTTLAFGTTGLNAAEIGSDLHLSGGLLWMYDGYLPVEHGFFLWPDTNATAAVDVATWAATGGSMAAKPDAATNTNAYYYQFVYEWTDNQGNAFRSAPSIPVAVTTTGAGTAGSVTLNIPTLRLTMKTANAVKIVVYRWSVAQQLYYQTTSVTTPLLNDTTADTVTFLDTNADATILGNNLLYTTGGVVENIAAPAVAAVTLFDSRLWYIDAEDRNLVGFSKQVIESTPVETTDLFSVYVPPSTGTQTSTGPLKSIYPMDDKIILGKDSALLYINGTGPDNTGANNQYSQPIFITSAVGSPNQNSIVLTPRGLMFESDKKGIWLLDRGLETSYVGAPVEDLTTGATVLSAINVPETNQVRFTLSSGVTLMYDYYYDQWGSFVGIPGLSSCIFQDLHAFINSHGQAYQETQGAYLDGSSPVLMQFQTGPLRLGDLQNYQRAYFFYLLGDYLSPHKLAVSLYYDYSESPLNGVILAPINFTAVYGSGPAPYGQENPYGGPGVAEEWRVFFKDQRCKAVSIGVQEIFDASFGVPAGAGLTLSGLNVVLGFKRGYAPRPAQTSTG